MTFSADWLALRAPADDRARAPAPLARLRDWAAGRPLRVVDLGAGTGATHRALAPHLPGARWRLVDSDPALLARAAAETGAETLRADLSVDLESLLAGADLVTASALTDLASPDWLARLAAALPPGAALYAALAYDGREDWRPADPAEAAALDAFRSHMRGPKGLGAGPAAGPEATAVLAARLAPRPLLIAPADWTLAAPADTPLIRALAEGAAAAVAETGALSPADHARWAAARAAARQVRIGHLDLLALPAA